MKILKNKTPSFGSWITLNHPSIAEILVDQKFDWLVLDYEHSVLSLSDIQTMISVIQSRGIPGWVRLSGVNKSEARKFLDAGADGLIVPMVLKPSDLMDVMEASLYPPAGKRTYGLSRAQKYGVSSKEYYREANHRVSIIAQIEHIDAVKCLDKILEIKGLDGIFVGPYDLSGSLGIPGELNDARVVQAEKLILNQCKKRGIPCGIHLVHPDLKELKAKRSLGYDFMALGTDFVFLEQASRAALEEARALFKIVQTSTDKKTAEGYFV